jgi:hypothetical protein
MSDDEITIDHSHVDEHSLIIDHAVHKPAVKPVRDHKPAHHTGRASGMSEAPKPVPPMQTVVQITVYREIGDHFEYLLLKRIDEDDFFWQVVTEPVASSSTIAETVRNAASEQIGIRGFKHLSNEMHSYEWYTSGERGRDIVFAAELDATTHINPDTSRFSEYAWLPANEAIQKLKWNGNKTAVRELDRNLVADRRAHPLPPTIGLYEKHYVPGGPTPAAASAMLTPDPLAVAVSDYSSQYTKTSVPKRLPDVPDGNRLTDLDGLPLAASDNDSNTSALFL